MVTTRGCNLTLLPVGVSGFMAFTMHRHLDINLLVTAEVVQIIKHSNTNHSSRCGGSK